MLQISQIEKPRCSATIDQMRLRRAMNLPFDSQYALFSGSQSEIQVVLDLLIEESLSERCRRPKNKKPPPQGARKRLSPRAAALPVRSALPSVTASLQRTLQASCQVGGHGESQELSNGYRKTVGARDGAGQAQFAAWKGTRCVTFLQCTIARHNAYGLLTSDFPGHEVRGDVARVECGPREGADAVGRFAGVMGLLARQRRVVKVGPKHRLRGRQQFSRQRRLTPTHHLG